MTDDMTHTILWALKRSKTLTAKARAGTNPDLGYLVAAEDISKAIQNRFEVRKIPINGARGVGWKDGDL